MATRNRRSATRAYADQYNEEDPADALIARRNARKKMRDPEYRAKNESAIPTEEEVGLDPAVEPYVYPDTNIPSRQPTPYEEQVSASANNREVGVIPQAERRPEPMSAEQWDRNNTWDRSDNSQFGASLPPSQRAGIDEMQNRDRDAARKARIAAMERRMTEDANRRHGGAWIGKQLKKVPWGTIGDRVSNYFNGDTPPIEVGLDEPAVAPLDAQPEQGAPTQEPIDPSMGNAVPEEVPEEVGVDPEGNNLQDDPATMGAIKDLKVPEVGIKKYKTINDIVPGDEEYNNLNQYQRDALDKDRGLLSSLQTQMGYEASRLNGTGVTGKRARKAYAVLSAQYNQARANITQKLNSFGIRTEAADVRKQLLTAGMNEAEIDAFGKIGAGEGAAKATAQGEIEVANVQSVAELAKVKYNKDKTDKDEARAQGVRDDEAKRLALDAQQAFVNSEQTEADKGFVTRVYEEAKTAIPALFESGDWSEQQIENELTSIALGAGIGADAVKNALFRSKDPETGKRDWRGKVMDTFLSTLSTGLLKQKRLGGAYGDGADKILNETLGIATDAPVDPNIGENGKGPKMMSIAAGGVQRKYPELPEFEPYMDTEHDPDIFMSEFFKWVDNGTDVAVDSTEALRSQNEGKSMFSKGGTPKSMSEAVITSTQERSRAMILREAAIAYEGSMQSAFGKIALHDVEAIDDYTFLYKAYTETIEAIKAEPLKAFDNAITVERLLRSTREALWDEKTRNTIKKYTDA